MTFRTNILAAAVATTLSLATVGATQSLPALAGGGCHDATFLDGATSRIDLKEACFYPMVARVPAGSAVTWTNREEMEHTVTGVALSFGTYDPLPPGKSVTYRFEKDGVYPYFCLLHPGMVGAVVVGSGNRTTVDPRAGIVRVAPAAARVSTAMAPAGSGRGWLPTLGLGALVVVVSSAVYATRRRRGRG